MALIINTPIENQGNQHLLDAKNVKGTFVVVNSVAERNALPEATRISGTLCYCTADSKFYQYNGTTWIEALTAITTEKIDQLWSQENV